MDDMEAPRLEAEALGWKRSEKDAVIADAAPLLHLTAQERWDLFVSIHANAAFNRSAKGYEVWILPGDYRRELIDAAELDVEARPVAPILNVLLEEEYGIESGRLAKAVLDGFDRTVGDLTENRGIREESWFVVRKAKMPSVLIELGYLTNREEARLLSDPSYLQKLAQGIYTGIRDFVASFENTKGFTQQTVVVP